MPAEPAIGITAESEAEALPYADAVRRHGGVPWLVLPGHELSTDAVMRGLRGLVVSGGVGKHPRWHGEEPQAGEDAEYLAGRDDSLPEEYYAGSRRELAQLPAVLTERSRPEPLDVMHVVPCASTAPTTVEQLIREQLAPVESTESFKTERGVVMDASTHVRKFASLGAYFVVCVDRAAPTSKCISRVSFAREIQLAPFSFSDARHSSTVFDLAAVVVHEGDQATSGHFVAYGRSPSDEWYLYDDRRVTGVQWEVVAAAEAHILLYTVRPHVGVRHLPRRDAQPQQPPRRAGPGPSPSPSSRPPAPGAPRGSAGSSPPARPPPPPPPPRVMSRANPPAHVLALASRMPLQKDEAARRQRLLQEESSAFCFAAAHGMHLATSRAQRLQRELRKQADAALCASKAAREHDRRASTARTADVTSAVEETRTRMQRQLSASEAGNVVLQQQLERLKADADAARFDAARAAEQLRSRDAERDELRLQRVAHQDELGRTRRELHTASATHRATLDRVEAQAAAQVVTLTTDLAKQQEARELSQRRHESEMQSLSASLKQAGRRVTDSEEAATEAEGERESLHVRMLAMKLRAEQAVDRGALIQQDVLRSQSALAQSQNELLQTNAQLDAAKSSCRSLEEERGRLQVALTQGSDAREGSHRRHDAERARFASESTVATRTLAQVTAERDEVKRAAQQERLAAEDAARRHQVESRRQAARLQELTLAEQRLTEILSTQQQQASCAGAAQESRERGQAATIVALTGNLPRVAVEREDETREWERVKAGLEREQRSLRDANSAKDRDMDVGRRALQRAQEDLAKQQHIASGLERDRESLVVRARDLAQLSPQRLVRDNQALQDALLEARQRAEREEALVRTKEAELGALKAKLQQQRHSVDNATSHAQEQRERATVAERRGAELQREAATATARATELAHQNAAMRDAFDREKAAAGSIFVDAQRAKSEAARVSAQASAQLTAAEVRIGIAQQQEGAALDACSFSDRHLRDNEHVVGTMMQSVSETHAGMVRVHEQHTVAMRLMADQAHTSAQRVIFDMRQFMVHLQRQQSAEAQQLVIDLQQHIRQSMSNMSIMSEQEQETALLAHCLTTATASQERLASVSRSLDLVTSDSPDPVRPATPAEVAESIARAATEVHRIGSVAQAMSFASAGTETQLRLRSVSAQLVKQLKDTSQRAATVARANSMPRADFCVLMQSIEQAKAVVLPLEEIDRTDDADDGWSAAPASGAHSSRSRSMTQPAFGGARAQMAH
jgi:hypothetical protein